MRFSVITVVWNDHEGLLRTADSVRAQTIADYEWLVIDGGSNDGTADLLETWTQDDALRWWSEADGGIYDAMNKGIERARGDYLVFLNAGDEFASSSTLHSVREVIDGKDEVIDFLYGDAIDIGLDGTERYRGARDHDCLWWTMFACHQAMYFRRQTVGQLRYDLNLGTSADYGFLARFLRPSDPGASVTVERFSGPLCRFWLGGISWKNRERALMNDFRIRRRHLGVSAPMGAALYVAHLAHTWLKRNVPALTQRVRYSPLPPD